MELSGVVIRGGRHLGIDGRQHGAIAVQRESFAAFDDVAARIDEVVDFEGQLGAVLGLGFVTHCGFATGDDTATETRLFLAGALELYPGRLDRLEGFGCIQGLTFVTNEPPIG